MVRIQRWDKGVKYVIPLLPLATPKFSTLIDNYIYPKVILK